MPVIGEIQRSRDVGLAFGKGSGKLIWQGCRNCGKERWVRLFRNTPMSQYCKQCGNIFNRNTPSGQEHCRWNGGRHKNNRGYVMVMLDVDDFFYPMVNRTGYVMEHRLVMAKHIRRLLQSWESVHHKNGVKDDNNIWNLEITSKGFHHKEHNKGYQDGYLKGFIDGRSKRIRELEVENKELRESIEYIRRGKK